MSWRQSEIDKSQKEQGNESSTISSLENESAEDRVKTLERELEIKRTNVLSLKPVESDGYVASQVKKLTCNILFGRMKFVANQLVLMDYTSASSVGRYVCNWMSIPHNICCQWWMTYSKMVDSGIIEMRNGAIKGIKAVWLSKYCTMRMNVIQLIFYAWTNV